MNLLMTVAVIGAAAIGEAVGAVLGRRKMAKHFERTITATDFSFARKKASIDDEARLDGIYVLRADEALVVKRLALHPAGRRVTVQSDNPAYPDWPDCDIDDLQCIGRVIWAGRKIG